MNGLIAFLVVVALFVAVVLLYQSMNRHLRKVPRTFDAPAEPAAPTDSPAEPALPSPPRAER